MALFGFGKKKEKTSCCCRTCDREAVRKVEQTNKVEASVKILGGGCAKCNVLEDATIEALNELNMDIAIEHITDFSQIAAYGVMSTPALVVDGKVVSMGKVLKKEEIILIFQKIRGL